MQRCFGIGTPASKSELSPIGSGFIGTDSRKPRSGSGSDVPAPLPSPPPEVSDGVEAEPMRAILPAGREGGGGLSEPPPHRWTLTGQNSDPVLLLHRRSVFVERWRRRLSC